MGHTKTDRPRSTVLTILAREPSSSHSLLRGIRYIVRYVAARQKPRQIIHPRAKRVVYEWQRHMSSLESRINFRKSTQASEIEIVRGRIKDVRKRNEFHGRHGSSGLALDKAPVTVTERTVPCVMRGTAGRRFTQCDSAN